MTVHYRLKSILPQLNKNAKSLAKEIGVTDSAISRVLNGQTLPSSKILIPLGEKFNININWLLFGTGEIFINTPISDTKNISGDLGTLQIGNNNKSKNINSNNTTADGYSKVKELETEIKLLKQHLREKDKQIESKDEVIRSKDENIASKDEIISLLKKK